MINLRPARRAPRPDDTSADDTARPAGRPARDGRSPDARRRRQDDRPHDARPHDGHPDDGRPHSPRPHDARPRPRPYEGRDRDERHEGREGREGHGRHARHDRPARPSRADSASSTPITPDSEVFSFFCPCPRGLEEALAHELHRLDARHISPTAGGVGCRGDLKLAYRINLEARLPSRVLLRLLDAPCTSEHTLYRLCHAQPWEDWFDARKSIRVDVVAHRSPLRSLNFATLRIKDAIVDRFRDQGGQRPPVDTHHPDVRISAFLTAERLQLYLDLSGEPLFKRGWRHSAENRVAAPLKENLAAGLLALSGWTPGQPLLDPFCGSGTLVIEAAQMLCDHAPGLDRHFGIDQLRIHDGALFGSLHEALRERARAGMAKAPHGLIRASDLDPEAMRLTAENLKALDFPEGLVALETADAVDVRPQAAPQGIIVANPPYNERVSIPIEHWRAIGATLRDHFGGWQVYLLTSDRGLPGQLGLRESRKTPLFNGAIECRLFEFSMRRREERPVPPKA